MSLRYTDKPYGGRDARGASDNWRSRFPQDAMPISQAPAQVIVAYGADGQGHLAHYRSGAYRKLTWQRDSKTRAGTLREDGTTLSNPVMFTLPRRG
jgi:hypothetical protein